MEIPSEYKVNKYITLCLIEGKTMIFINGKKFRQCKYLFIVNPQSDFASNVKSIDDAAEMLDSHIEESYTPEDLGITEKEIFWGHCSNLQAWAESGYDTRLLHSNLAFPLLKKLTESGDIQASRVFKEEIVSRFLKGSTLTRQYLCEENYIQLLQEEELTAIMKASSAHAIKLIEERLEKKLNVTLWKTSNRGSAYKWEEGMIIELKLNGEFRFKEIPNEVQEF
ncbi:MAG: hypothetical protein EU541_08680, partial [Promethearchaeota archaeon]